MPLRRRGGRWRRGTVAEMGDKAAGRPFKRAPRGAFMERREPVPPLWLRAGAPSRRPGHLSPRRPVSCAFVGRAMCRDRAEQRQGRWPSAAAALPARRRTASAAAPALCTPSARLQMTAIKMGIEIIVIMRCAGRVLLACGGGLFCPRPVSGRFHLLPAVWSTAARCRVRLPTTPSRYRKDRVGKERLGWTEAPARKTASSPEMRPGRVFHNARG